YQGLGGGLGELRSTTRTSTTPPTYPRRLARCAAPVAEANAILLVTPEHNGSTPGGLKNAIDWLSSPDFSCGLAVSGGGGAGRLVGLLVAGGHRKIARSRCGGAGFPRAGGSFVSSGHRGRGVR
ncbi:MAG TPA: NAD(P)H-dependent oxidoreductase, partial [Gemmatimonadales bacterium]|nr:NAD(P)H-dependent oxidoreductase [Gemmatimonadales bacterium]